MRQRQKALSKQTEALSAGERLLARQRYQFGDGWPQTSMVEAAYVDFETILGRRCVTRSTACHVCRQLRDLLHSGCVAYEMYRIRDVAVGVVPIGLDEIRV